MGIRLSHQTPIAGDTTRRRDHDVTEVFEAPPFFDDTVWPSERPVEANESDGRQDECTQQNPGPAWPTKGNHGKDDEQEREEILEVDEVSTESYRWASRPQLDELTQHSLITYHINRHVPCYFQLRHLRYDREPMPEGTIDGTESVKL